MLCSYYFYRWLLWRYSNSMLNQLCLVSYYADCLFFTFRYSIRVMSDFAEELTLFQTDFLNYKGPFLTLYRILVSSLPLKGGSPDNIM